MPENLTPRGYTVPTINDPFSIATDLKTFGQSVANDVNALDTRITSAESKITASSATPQRRIFVSTSVSAPFNTTLQLNWTSRGTTIGDPGNPASGQPGMTLESDGKIRLSTAGLYQVNLFSDAGKFPGPLQLNNAQGYIYAVGNSGSSAINVSFSGLVAMAANDYFAVTYKSTSSSDNTSGFQLSIVRLGA